ncbi:MAG: biotin/lipoyl-binding protein [Planctomycetota bacterium]
MKYHRLRPDEYFILCRLRPGVTLQSLREAYQDRHPPYKVSLSQLNQLLFQFHRLGLTLSDAEQQGDRLREKQRSEARQRWMQLASSVLFIRFPGFDPEPLMRRLYPIVRPLLSPLAMAGFFVIVFAAVLTFIAHWERFYAEFPDMHQWIHLKALLTLAAVIGVTKILHEFGHAVVCRHFGGECHQIGPMLLVFTPALYCDTSDSWMFRNRFQRAAVGVAGIATEVVLASMATLIWATTGPTVIHYVAMNVMLVCSVSTILFNANPLLRYDGYYVLSDLADVPNLSQVSNRFLSRSMGQLLFGLPAENDEPRTLNEQFWLAVYALSAFLYRWTLTVVILWFLMQMLRPFRLESVGTILCLFAIGGLLFSVLRSPIAFLRNPVRRRQIRMGRLVKSSVIFAALVVLACWPLPSGESADGRLVPRTETPIYAATGGHVDEVRVSVGQRVSKGDVIAVLADRETTLEFEQAKARYQKQYETVAALRANRVTTPESANELPQAEVLLEELKRQLEVRQTRLDALIVRAPDSGRLIDGPYRPRTSDDEVHLVRWSGSPVEAANRGCYLESGTELFSLITDDRWDAELMMTSTQAQRIAVGSDVKLVCASMPSMVLHGNVTNISVAEWNAEENRERRDDSELVRRTQPVEVSYAVRIALAPDGAAPVMLTGAQVSARVSTEPISFMGRAMRLLNRLLRFR